MLLSLVQVELHRVARGHGLPVDLHAHALFLGRDHHGLFTDASHQVRRLSRFAAFRQFLAVFRNALLDRSAHFLVD
jgi:hypothetical protein